MNGKKITNRSQMSLIVESLKLFFSIEIIAISGKMKKHILIITINNHSKPPNKPIVFL